MRSGVIENVGAGASSRARSWSFNFSFRIGNLATVPDHGTSVEVDLAQPDQASHSLGLSRERRSPDNQIPQREGFQLMRSGVIENVGAGASSRARSWSFNFSFRIGNLATVPDHGTSVEVDLAQPDQASHSLGLSRERRSPDNQIPDTAGAEPQPDDWRIDRRP